MTSLLREEVALPNSASFSNTITDLALKRERPPDRKADDNPPYDYRIDIRHASFPPIYPLNRNSARTLRNRECGRSDLVGRQVTTSNFPRKTNLMEICAYLNPCE